MAAHWIKEDLKETVRRLLLYTADVLRDAGIDPSAKIAMRYVADAIVNGRDRNPPFRELARSILEAINADKKFWDEVTRRLLLFTILELKKHKMDRGENNNVAITYVLRAVEEYLELERPFTEDSVRDIAKLIREAIRRVVGR